MPSSERWLRVAALADLREDEVFTTRLGELELALARIGAAVHAFEDVCTHECASLSQGFLEGGEIECPLHGARFDIATGRCLAAPAERDLRTFPVRIEGEDIYVGLTMPA
jgi:naphthalene 1,2-dioxygenase system ferredoxin subunit